MTQYVIIYIYYIIIRIRIYIYILIYYLYNYMTPYDQIRVNASGWLLKSDWIPVFLDILTGSVGWCCASQQTNRHQWAWLHLQMKEPNAGLGGFGLHASCQAWTTLTSFSKKIPLASKGKHRNEWHQMMISLCTVIVYCIHYNCIQTISNESAAFVLCQLLEQKRN